MHFPSMQTCPFMHSSTVLEHLQRLLIESQYGAAKLSLQLGPSPHWHSPSLQISPGFTHASLLSEHLHLLFSASQKGAITFPSHVSTLPQVQFPETQTCPFRHAIVSAEHLHKPASLSQNGALFILNIHESSKPHWHE